MAMEYTEEQLNHFDKSTLVQLFLVQQSQLKDIDQKLQLLLEQGEVYSHLSEGERHVIQIEAGNGASIRGIGAMPGRSPSSISREIHGRPVP